MKENLYFIAVMPPETIQKEVTDLKFLFKDEYQAKHALKSPPHITLLPPFKWKEDREQELIVALDSFTETCKGFWVRLNGFGAFPPRVIFINVEENEELNSLFHQILKRFDKIFDIKKLIRNSERFNPHLTLATRDLKRENFQKAWGVFRKRSYDETFFADNVVLLKHNGGFWEVLSNSYFRNN